MSDATAAASGMSSSGNWRVACPRARRGTDDDDVDISMQSYVLKISALDEADAL